MQTDWLTGNIITTTTPTTTQSGNQYYYQTGGGNWQGQQMPAGWWQQQLEAIQQQQLQHQQLDFQRLLLQQGSGRLQKFFTVMGKPVTEESFKTIAEMGRKIMETFEDDYDGPIQLTKYQYAAVKAYLTPIDSQGFVALQWRGTPIIQVE